MQPEIISAIADSITALMAVGGVLFSVYFGIRNLKKIEEELRHQKSPILVFSTITRLVKCELRKTSIIPGISHEDSKRILNLGLFNYEYICNLGDIGTIQNYGQGVAVDASVWFEAHQMIKNDGSVVAVLRQIVPFTREWNLVPIPGTPLSYGQSAEIGRLPTCVFLMAPEVDEIRGNFWICCFDADGREHVRRQEVSFRIINRTGSIPQLAVKFGRCS